MAVVANTDWFIANFMTAFLGAHMRGGIEVIAASPAGDYVDRLKRAGMRWAEVPMSRGRGSLRSNLATLRSLRRLARQENPDLIHFVTAKSVIMGNLAMIAKDSPPTINVLPGLGHSFSSRGLLASVDRRVLHWGVGWAAARPRSITVFHQPADEETMLGRGSRTRGRTAVIPGWGIDLARFSPVSRPAGPPLVVMVSRMLWSKGVEDYVKAAEICRESLDARFVLVGDPDLGNPAPVPTEQLEAWHRTGWVEWWRHRDDIPDVLAQASVFVLPSRYGEGVPQALIEAAAMGIPIVASDLPGCRQVVDHGRNGLLITPGDVKGLAEGILGLLGSPAMLEEMGIAGVRVARERFSTVVIFDAYRRLYEAMGLQLGGG